MNKDASVIPYGEYCHGDLIIQKNGTAKCPNMCPYWSKRKGKTKQENGYCSYLKKGDWDINAETEVISTRYVNGKKTVTKYKKGESPINMSLLWDMVKYCDINMDNV